MQQVIERRVNSMRPAVIVGCGPLGLALSLVLARYGMCALNLEAREAHTPRDEPRIIP